MLLTLVLLLLWTIPHRCVNVNHHANGTSTLFGRQLADEETVDSKKYFLAIMTRVRDEINGILEFVQHYLEEGVDHFYIFDDGSTDSTVEALRCIPKQYYTIFTNELLSMKEQEYFQKHWPNNVMQYEQLYEMYVFLGVREESEWVMVVDVDELMVSRAQPQRTVRQLLQTQLSHCDVVSVPTIFYSWGHSEHTVPNAVRYRLFYRWSFEERFARRVGGKYRDIDAAVDVKAIVRTRSVAVVGAVHWASFGDGLGKVSTQTGLVCVSHTQPRLRCASACADHVDLDALSGKVRRNVLIANHAPGDHDDCAATGRLSPFCPPQNQLISLNSPRAVKLAEEDVGQLLLGLHHYRLVSLDDFERKSNANRSSGAQYMLRHGQTMAIVNRMDLVDPFMATQRLPARRGRAGFVTAEKIMSSCVSDVFKPISATEAAENARIAMASQGVE